VVILRSAPAFLEPKVYPALVESVESFEGDYGLSLRWRFILEIAPHKKRLTAYSNPPTGPRSKASRWATAVLGRPVDSGEFSEDDLAGRQCRVELSLAQHEDGDFYNVVETVLPFAEQVPLTDPDPGTEEFVLNPSLDDDSDSVPF
jgi:hypothetical protein